MNNGFIALFILIGFFVILFLILKLIFILLDKHDNNKKEKFRIKYHEVSEFKDFVYSMNRKISETRSEIYLTKNIIDRLYKETCYYPKDSKFYISLEEYLKEKQKILIELKNKEEFLENQLTEYVIKHESCLDDLKKDYLGDYIQWKQFVKERKNKYLSNIDNSDLT